MKSAGNKNLGSRLGTRVRLFQVYLFQDLQLFFRQGDVRGSQVAFQLFKRGCADDIAGHKGAIINKGQGHLRWIKPKILCQLNITCVAASASGEV